MITHVGSVTVEVPDLSKSIEFFERKIGLELTERVDGTAYLRSADRHHDLILVQSLAEEPGLRHLNLAVADGTLDDDVARAITAGALDLGAINHSGISRGRLLEIPGGFVVKLYEGMERVPAPAPSELPRPLHFSHFNIGVPDVATHMSFFMEAFGLRPSDWIGSTDDPFIAWLHCPVPGANHHGIAVLKSEKIRLHHIAFDYRDVTEVIDRVDNYVDASHYLVWGVGRHGTGGSIFAYLEDHSGMMVELGSGMIRIGEDPRWNGPQVWSLEDRRGVDEWGSSVPDAWLAKHVAVLAPQTLQRK
ncbi:VOC family protein [Arthrobacter sp. D3-16]